MQYQDPMDPMSGTEFASQLAQFSSVEQLTDINTELGQSITANSVLTQSINNDLSATFIGKNVEATTNTFTYSGTGNTQLGYNLPSAANTVTVNISDSLGKRCKNDPKRPDRKRRPIVHVGWDGQFGESSRFGDIHILGSSDRQQRRIDHRVALHLRDRLRRSFQFHRHGVRYRRNGSSAF